MYGLGNIDNIFEEPFRPSEGDCDGQGNAVEPSTSTFADREASMIHELGASTLYGDKKSQTDAAFGAHPSTMTHHTFPVYEPDSELTMTSLRRQNYNSIGIDSEQQQFSVGQRCTDPIYMGGPTWNTQPSPCRTHVSWQELSLGLPLGAAQAGNTSGGPITEKKRAMSDPSKMPSTKASGESINEKMRAMTDIPRHSRRPRGSTNGNTSGDSITEKMRAMTDIPRQSRQSRMPAAQGFPQSKSNPKLKHAGDSDNNLLIASLIAGFDIAPTPTPSGTSQKMQYEYQHNTTRYDNVDVLPYQVPSMLRGDGYDYNNTMSTANVGQLGLEQDHTNKFHFSEARNPLELSGLMSCAPPGELQAEPGTPDLYRSSQLSFASLPTDIQEPVEAVISSSQAMELASTSDSSYNAAAASSDGGYPSQDQPDSERPSTLSLSVDKTFLDPVHIFLRRDCIEVFEMTDEDVKGSLKRAGRVGLRCRYCKHLSKSELASQAVCFPSKRSTIFESIRNFRRFHLNECPCIPKQVKNEFKCMEQQISCGKSTISHRYIKAYYIEAASDLGLVDTPNGLMFGASPNTSGAPSTKLQSVIKAARDPVYASQFWNVYSSASVAKKSSEKITLEDVATEATRRVIVRARKEPTVLVRPEDFPTVSNHHFVLYHQFVPSAPPESLLQCTEQCPPALIGLCCKHCSSRVHAGVLEKNKDTGKFFPPDLKNFGDSFYVNKLLNHIITCDNAPKEVRDALEELQRLALEHGATSKKGSRIRFIKKVWARLEEYSRITAAS